MSVATPEVEAETETDCDEQHLVLYGIDWDQYVTINDALPDRRGVRMIYIDGSLTILTLSRRHDWHVSYLDKIVVAVAFGCGIEQEMAGSVTFRLASEKVGVEGDRTYYFGANAEIMNGPIDIDLATQPPPDLAIEVELTHSAKKAIATYARIGVPEVWRYDVRKASLTFLILGQDRVYHPAARSLSLPLLMPEDVLGQLLLADESNSFSRWFAQLPEWVRTTILPRAIEG
jgi:Uma2 family endonuclease